MGRLLLLGAGFTRNWNGWLAGELADDLISRLPSDEELCRRLIANPNFEEVLGDLQREWVHTRQDAQRQRLDNMQEAIRASFDDMNRMLGERPGLEFPGAMIFAERTVASFLARFDAIFTLNQDLLLELHYTLPIAPAGRQRWVDRPQLPGMRVPPNFWTLRTEERLIAEWLPLPENDYRVEHGSQPIFKLHGSVNWRSANGGDLLVMGANKVAAIAGSSLLTWYANEFREHLRERGNRLMTIGYGFGDQHINSEIVESANADPAFGLFVVDPNGRRVFRPRPEGQIPAGRLPIEDVRYIGGSARPLRSTFTDDELERQKLMRFFDA
jgi:hypothetical protein